MMYADHFGHEATALNVTILNASLVKDGPPVTMGSHFMSDAPDATGMDAAQLNFAYTGSIS